MQALGSTRRRVLAGILGAVLGLPALSLGFHAYAVKDRGPDVHGAADGPFGDRRELAPGLLHVRLQGEGYALGLRHGTVLKGEVQAMVGSLHELIGSPVSRDIVLLKAWQLDEKAQPRYRAEMRGVADGAGVPYADVLLINTYDDLMHLVGCSSAVALPEGGEPLRHGRNLDYPIPELARRKVLFDIETRGVQLRTVGFPGYIGVLTGMSSRGLGLSSHTSAVPRSRVGTPSGLVYRQMLEESQDLAEMQLILTRAARTIGNNLALSDAHGGAALALELDAEHVYARQPEGGRLLVTNHFQLPAMQRHQSPRAYARESGSSSRITCLARSLPPGRRIGAADLRQALSEHGVGKGWRTPANAGTVQSIVMEPATGHLWVASGLTLPVTEGGYVEVGGAWSAR